jgi:hypothetical protein
MDPDSIERADDDAATGTPVATVAADTASVTDPSTAHERTDLMKLLLDGANLRHRLLRLVLAYGSPLDTVWYSAGGL